MANKLIKLRPVSVSTSTPEAGPGKLQSVNIPITGLSDGAGVAIDRSENIYVTDSDRHVVFKIRRGSSASLVFAGKLDTAGNVDGQGQAARFDSPGAIAVDRGGVLWLVDGGNNLVRRIDQNGNVFTVASIPPRVLNDAPGHIAVDDTGNIFMIDNTP